MDLGIRNRVAVVAASSRGMGRAVAAALAAEGAHLALCARNAETLAATAAEIRERSGVKVFEQALDVTDYAAVQRFIAETGERLGPVEICVTNAGGPPAGTFADFEPDDWRRAFELNFMSTLSFIREVLPGMKNRRWGRIVSITSTSVKQPIEGLILSNAVRAAVVGLMKSLTAEYGPHGILCNNVGPGLIATDRLLDISRKRAADAGVSEAEMLERMTQAVALRRVGQPEEFAAVVAFLCSERARYVTGNSVMIDGGLVKGI